MAVTAAQVKDLRQKTGAGMMDCKAALSEADGDMEAAIAILRKKGAASAEKKATRIAAEGAVLARVADEGACGVLLEVNCETDFVARDDTFRAFMEQVADAALAHNPADTEALGALSLSEGSVEDARLAISGKVGENIRIRRFTLMREEGMRVCAYNHGGRIGVLVALQGESEVGHNIAMHVAAINPLCVSAEQLSPQLLDKEREIYAAQAAESGKPPQIIEKMIEGRLRKFTSANTLLGQPFVKDTEQQVEQYLKGAGATVGGFVRYVVGEGLEKRHDDFVAEVRAQAGAS